MNEYLDYIKSEIINTTKVLSKIANSDILTTEIQSACHMIVHAINNGKKLMLAGNGGSAADAQHIAAEFVSRFYYDRKALPAIALTTDTSILTAIGNDYGYEDIFSRQIEALGSQGDVFLAISTSGNSKNILKALHSIHERQDKITTIGLTGENGGTMRSLCDLCICVPHAYTPKIQEAHIVIGHIICAIAEKSILKNS